VIDELPDEVVRILERGSFCHVVAATPSGPHVTPLVFALAHRRLWVTTSRGSVKARAWARDRSVSGLVRSDDLALSFVGRAETYDLLDADTWGRAARAVPTLTAAAVEFTRKNARFFAGYAADAHRVPLSWTPPGRTFVEIRIERAAVIDDSGVRGRWGVWRPSLVARERFRAARTGTDPLARLPDDVRAPLGDRGIGALAVEGPNGAVVLPARWANDGVALFAALQESVLQLAGCEILDAPMALAVDRASWWRARKMIGAMVQGSGEVYALERLTSGMRSADARAELAGADPHGAALVRIRPTRMVWWHGWSSGTVRVT
jgi:hypothetical protein